VAWWGFEPLRRSHTIAKLNNKAQNQTKSYQLNSHKDLKNITVSVKLHSSHLD